MEHPTTSRLYSGMRTERARGCLPSLPGVEERSMVMHALFKLVEWGEKVQSVRPAQA